MKKLLFSRKMCWTRKSSRDVQLGFNVILGSILIDQVWMILMEIASLVCLLHLFIDCYGY